MKNLPVYSKNRIFASLTKFWFSTAQHSTAQHITAQHITAQHITAQHLANGVAISFLLYIKQTCL